jgi:hypothetical protein
MQNPRRPHLYEASGMVEVKKLTPSLTRARKPDDSEGDADAAAASASPFSSNKTPNYHCSEYAKWTILGS